MEKLLFSELRILVRDKLANKDVNLNLEKALTDSKNLEALGYKLKFEGIVALAEDYALNKNMKPLYKRVLEFNPEIEVSPMYPNFPIQVLEMDEFEFRIHQLIHYATTYGLEDMLGIEITKGWLPETDEIKERTEDKHLINLKFLDYISEEEANLKVIKDLIGRPERLMSKELELAKKVIFEKKGKVEDIPFKENIGLIFGEVILTGKINDRNIAIENVANVVKHPGDVLDVVEQLVVLNKYKHLKTSVKRSFVELIESFPIKAIEENLASNRWSNKFLGKGGKSRSINRNIALIDYLSYNRFSKNDDAKEIVNQLKSGKLLSWNQKLEMAYQNENIDYVLELLRDRPGIYFRQLNRVIGLGADTSIVNKDMTDLGGQLKTQSIVSALNNFDGDEKVVLQFYTALIASLKDKEIEELKDKKVFIEESEVDFDFSKIEIVDKFEEGGYITNGMAIKIPEDSEFIRFFTYWNDERRIDIDLHAMAAGEENIHIGWNGSHKYLDALVHSGDITHSDAAEYLDLNVKEAKKAGINRVQFNINSYTTIPFIDIETMFAGLMAVSEMNQKVKLYDSKNVIFRHDIKNKSMAVDYALIDLEKDLIYILGSSQNSHNDRNIVDGVDVNLSISDYLKILIISQNAKIVDNKDEADVVLGLAKSDQDNYFSLLDKNFFM